MTFRISLFSSLYSISCFKNIEINALLRSLFGYLTTLSKYLNLLMSCSGVVLTSSSVSLLDVVASAMHFSDSLRASLLYSGLSKV